MTEMFPSRTLSVSIARCARGVYDFVSKPENLPRWAGGLGRSITQKGDDWIVDAPQGSVKFKFAEKNDFGVLDNYVTTAAGAEIYVPMRVVRNGSGSEVIFTLFQLPGMTDEAFAGDVKLVEQDLQMLKNVLEK